MEYPIAVLILAAFVSWVCAELRGGRIARFITGAVAILAAYFVGQFVASVVPSYERSVTRASMHRLSELLVNGQTDRVRNAVEIYNITARQENTYAAARKMWDTVSRKQGGATGGADSPEQLPSLPKGVSLHVVSGNVILTLDEGTAIQVRQNRADRRTALIGHMDGKLQVLQLEQSGETPRSMDLISREKAQFSVTTASGTEQVMILDEDGDGIPDIKIEDNKKFRRGNIEWVEAQQPK